MNIPKVSVIIPVYGAEKYIERCARSLFEQTLDDIEYIFVDDRGPDKSIDILRSVLEEYPSRKHNTKIVVMPQNGKQAAARNAGLKHSTGEYVIHCDPDDWVEKDMYQSLYSIATQTNADVVICQIKCLFKDYETIVDYENVEDPRKAVNTRVMNTAYSLCNKLIRRTVIKENDISFFDGVNFTEDRNFVIRCYHKANKLAYLNIPYYYADRTNENSINNATSDEFKTLQAVKGIQLLEQWLGKDASIYQLYFDQRKYALKNNYIAIGDYRKFRNTFPELNASLLTNHNYQERFVYRLCQQLIIYHIDFPMRFCKWLMNKLRKA